MTSSLFLSAMTIVAITGTTLVTLKYNSSHHDDDNTDFIAHNDSSEIDSDYNYRISPKFHYDANKSEPSMDNRIVKRSIDEISNEYVISDKNLSMIDEAKREKVKEVDF